MAKASYFDDTSEGKKKRRRAKAGLWIAAVAAAGIATVFTGGAALPFMATIGVSLLVSDKLGKKLAQGIEKVIKAFTKPSTEQLLHEEGSIQKEMKIQQAKLDRNRLKQLGKLQKRERMILKSGAPSRLMQRAIEKNQQERMKPKASRSVRL